MEIAASARDLSFRYGADQPQVLSRVEFSIPVGSRCLVVGANGAGKTTLLRLIAGKHLVDSTQITVLGRSAFHDATLVEDVVFLGGEFRFEVDVEVRTILEGIAGPAARRDYLVHLLGVDPAWHMHRVSNGQRRRVQLLVGLIRPRKLLLLDEITTDLDLVARVELLDFLKRESEERGVTILYATHILDRLEVWATDLLLLEQGRLRLHSPLGTIDELARLKERAAPSPLSALIERWLREPGSVGTSG